MQFTLLFAISPLFAQTATEYNDKDKKKLAEIAQRPEVIKRIQDTWDAHRRADMEFAFNVNQSSRAGQLSVTELATFRQNFGELYTRVAESVFVPIAAGSGAASGSAYDGNDLYFDGIGLHAGQRGAACLRAGP
jgi:hypothetical protein